MSLIKIKFLVAGMWMDQPSQPVFNVEAGEEMEVSARLAKDATDAGKAEFVTAAPKPQPKVEPEVEAGPTPKAETGPTPKAEGKKKKAKAKS